MLLPAKEMRIRYLISKIPDIYNIVESAIHSSLEPYVNVQINCNRDKLEMLEDLLQLHGYCMIVHSFECNEIDGLDSKCYSIRIKW